MTQLERLEQRAYDAGISIYNFHLSASRAASAANGNLRGVAIDKTQLNDTQDESAVLAHELGHFFANAMYGQGATQHEVALCERRAWDWAFLLLVPPDKLAAHLREYDENTHAIAQELGLPEWFVRKACLFYWPDKCAFQPDQCTHQPKG